MAFENDHFDVVKYLIDESENNLDLESCNECQKTVLHWACEHEYKDIVESLIKKGAYLDAQSLSGYTPLHYSVKCYHWVHVRHWDIAKLLLEAGADSNLEDFFGNTAFHYYIPCSLAIGLKVFIENGAFMQSNGCGFSLGSYDPIRDFFFYQTALITRCKTLLSSCYK